VAHYLLDTNICIYIRQSRPSSVATRFHALPPGAAVMSVITFGELRYGAEKSRTTKHALEILGAITALIPVESLPVCAGADYGEILALLSRRGEMIGNNDLWIAAHARSSDLTLVTNNEREFRRVPGLRVENWAAA
jgi:tRNA(fMet)-specific endonuclease VapC